MEAIGARHTFWVPRADSHQPPPPSAQPPPGLNSRRGCCRQRGRVSLGSGAVNERRFPNAGVRGRTLWRDPSVLVLFPLCLNRRGESLMFMARPL